MNFSENFSSLFALTDPSEGKSSLCFRSRSSTKGTVELVGPLLVDAEDEAVSGSRLATDRLASGVFRESDLLW